MTYGKFVNENIVFAPHKLRFAENTVYNPTAAQYRSAGYKPLVFTDEPETEIGYHAEEVWTDDGESIVQSWNIVEDPPDEDIPDDEAVAILLGGAS